MMWAALFQQRPAPEEGDYFKAAWLKPYDGARTGDFALLWRRDYAVTADGGDLTVHFVVGVDPEGRCTCSTCGGSRRRPMCGWRRSAIW